MAQIFKINDVDYEFECTLTNSDGQKIEFTKSAIKGMAITEDIFSPFVGGSISIANPYDFIENKYLLRGDGRDELYLMFKPVDGADDSKIEHTFIVSNDENHVNPSVRSENIKTLQLIDKNELPFLEETTYNKRYSGKVGDIIKEIFKDLLGEDIIDEDNWESGDFEYSYSPPVYSRYIDVLNKMLQIYYFKDDDIHVKSFLSYDKSKNKYSLIPISKLFSRNKELLSESFAMGDLTDTIDYSNPNNPPPEGEVGEYIGQLKNLGYSTPLFDWNNNYFVDCAVHRFDDILGIFKLRQLKLVDVEEGWKSKFVDVFKSISGKPKPFLVKNKKTSKKIKHFNLPYPVEDAVNIVEADMVNNLTFYNLQCSFSNIGDGRRTSGSFIDIFKTKDEELKSDEKILGRWFVTSVKHIFFSELYQNQIFGLKTYVGPQSKIDNDAE